MNDTVFNGPIYPSTIIKKVLKSQPMKLNNDFMLNNKNRLRDDNIISSTKEQV